MGVHRGDLGQRRDSHGDTPLHMIKYAHALRIKKTISTWDCTLWLVEQLETCLNATFLTLDVDEVQRSSATRWGCSLCASGTGDTRTTRTTRPRRTTRKSKEV